MSGLYQGSKRSLAHDDKRVKEKIFDRYVVRSEMVDVPATYIPNTFA